MADIPALPERLSDEQVQDVIDYGDACGTFSVSLAREVRDLRRASPRREAPADEVEALADIIQAAMEDEDSFLNAARCVFANGYSPEGQTVIDGKRWSVHDPHTNGVGLTSAELRPVGTEEADTDG